MLDDVADGGEAAVAMRADGDFQGVVAVLLEPGMPLLAFPIGVVHQGGEIKGDGHGGLLRDWMQRAKVLGYDAQV